MKLCAYLRSSTDKKCVICKAHTTLLIRGALSWRWWCAVAAATGLAAATVVVNSVALVALWRARTAPAHYPLASLAAADLLVGLFVVPVAAARELFVFHLNWAICSCWRTLDVLCCTASILSLCALGWERWCGITAPLARARRARLARVYAGLVWPVASAVALPTAFISTPRHYHEGELVKACPDNTNVAYVFCSTILSFYLPATVMLVLYARILCALASPPAIRSHRGRSPTAAAGAAGDGHTSKPPTRIIMTSISRCGIGMLRRDTEKSQEDANLATQKGIQLNLPDGSKADPLVTTPKRTGLPKYFRGGIASRQRRATRTIVRLMALFLMCWTPFFVMLPLDSLCDCIDDNVWEWCTWLGYINSALNPLVYAAASPSVRRALRASFTSSSTRNTDVPTSPSGRRA